MCCSKLSPDLCDPMDCSPPGTSVHGIFEARILQWVAISYQGLFPIQGLKLHLLHLLYWQADSLPLCHLESPGFKLYKIDFFIEYIYIWHTDSSVDKESTCNTGDLGLIPVLGRSPGEGKSYPLQYSGLENSMDYSPWGHKESDMT